jgi:hypothetical protein
MVQGLRTNIRLMLTKGVVCLLCTDGNLFCLQSAALENLGNVSYPRPSYNIWHIGLSFEN